MKLIYADILKQWANCWKEAVLAGFLLMVAGRQISYIFNKHKSPRILLFANGVFIYYLLYVTLLMRSIGSRREVEFLPFNSYELSRGDFHYLIENMLLFVPFGVLLYVNLYIYGRKCNIKTILLTALLASVSIEFLQYAFSCGKSEIDDVLANVLGALIGYAISRLIFWVFFSCKNSLSRKNT
ncbi:MAG: VanZ family protein [Butyrivibrio sp.]|nr:VanZ family protein [Butyrivibrio sp.]